MKNLKKSCALFVLFVLLCSCLVACAGGATGSGDSTSANAAPAENPVGTGSADSAQTNSEKDEAAKTGPENAAPEADESKSTNPEPGQKELHIGILQFAQHPSLDNCREGFLKGLAENGFVEGQNLTVDVQNAQADMGICGQIAAQFAGKKLDLICAIATPAAMSAYNAAQSKEIPVIYTAISDPVAAQLADSDKKPLGEVTGTSDRLPIKEQLSLIRKVLPDAKNIGILFSTSEANSVSMLEVYKKLAPEYGFEIVDSGISSSSDIPLACDALLKKVDALSNLTDNTVVNSLPLILSKAKAKNIPVFGSEIEQVRLGCLASEGIEYISLGRQTGAMAAKILRGEAKASELPYEEIAEASLSVNLQATSDLGIKFSDELLARAVEKFTEISSANK